MTAIRDVRRLTPTGVILIAALVAMPCAAGDKKGETPPRKHYRGLLGPGSKKVKTEGGKTWLWAGVDQWYDFTGSPLPAAELQFGIGKDRIRSIDDPLFVQPDDPRLLNLPPSHYRRDPKPRNNDAIMVTGFAEGDQARAYPIGLLDHHELVNDRVGGKPVTVGW